MKLLRDYKCDQCGHVFERFSDSKKADCQCGGVAHTMIGMPTVKLEGLSGAFPGAHDRWAKIREEKHRAQLKRER